MEKLSIVTKSVLRSGDDFGYEIICSEYATEIIYFEVEKEIRVAKTTVTFPAEYDVQVFEAAIKLRDYSTTFIDYPKGGHSMMSSVIDNDSVENETEPEMVDTSKTLLDIDNLTRR